MSQDVPQHASRFDETYRPVARTEDLERTYSEGKVLLYDKRSHHIHHLDDEVTAVWHYCSGTLTPDAISIATGIHPDRVKVALKKLVECDLLVGAMPVSPSVPRLSRRKLATFGIAALPTIKSISAPSAATIPSCTADNNSPCRSDADCCAKPNGRGGFMEGVCIDPQNDPGLCLY